MRLDGRQNNEWRNIQITRNFTKYAEGSVLISIGETKVICTASIEDRVPPFRKNSGEGWLTAEYSMLPRATTVRNSRDIGKLKLNGRTQEIQRLIGRSLRTVLNTHLLGERSIFIDCDVIQADGGTRTAAITGAYVALADALNSLVKNKTLPVIPLTNFIAAISVGIVNDANMVDLCYAEDSNAIVDMNVVMTERKDLVEIQGTGEQSPFCRTKFNKLLDFAEDGILNLIQIQKDVLGDITNEIGRVSKNEKIYRS